MKTIMSLICVLVFFSILYSQKNILPDSLTSDSSIGEKYLSGKSKWHSFGTNMVPKVGIRAVQKLMEYSKIEPIFRYENANVLDIQEVSYF